MPLAEFNAQMRTPALSRISEIMRTASTFCILLPFISGAAAFGAACFSGDDALFSDVTASCRGGDVGLGAGGDAGGS